MMQHAIIAENIFKAYKQVKAVHGISLRAQTGQVLGLLGPNGAGKTTLVRILTTLLKPDSGYAEVAGIDVVKSPMQARERFGLAGQYPAVDEMLTGRENLEMVGQLYHFSRAEAKARARALLTQFALEDAANRPVKTYSGGMRRRLDLAASLVARPAVLFLDEPTTGLDPRTRMGLWETIRQLVTDGTTLLLTTQYLEEADVLADRIAVIDAGKVIAEGTSDELKAQLGGERLEIKLQNPRDLDRAMPILMPIGKEAPQLEASLGLLTLPVAYGTRSLVEAVRLLDEASIAIDDLSLRRPTLDDVFLTLTGQKTSVA